MDLKLDQLVIKKKKKKVFVANIHTVASRILP